MSIHPQPFITLEVGLRELRERRFALLMKLDICSLQIDGAGHQILPGILAWLE